MNLSRREQARLLHKTIKRLQTQVIVQNIRQVFPLDGEPCELTMTQVGTLMAVRDSGAASIKEIAEATRVSPPSASTMVDKLVEMGVLSREQSKADRREVLVRVTPEAERISEALEKGMLGSLEEILEAIGPKMAEQWCEVYGRIQELFDADVPSSSDDGALSRGSKAV